MQLSPDDTEQETRAKQDSNNLWLAGSRYIIGTSLDYYGSQLPTGFLWVDGSAVSCVVYPDLDATIYCGDANNATAPCCYRCTDPANPNGTRSTTGAYIVLPDARHRVTVGKDSNDSDFATVGQVGGEKKHTLTIDEMPSHTHDVYVGTARGNSGTYMLDYDQNGSGQLLSGGNDIANGIKKIGGNQPHNTLQPYIVCNKIIAAYVAPGSVSAADIADAKVSAHNQAMDAHNVLFANKVDKVTGKSLISDTEITRLSNAPNLVSDASYTHTDNNYTSSEKSKLTGLTQYTDNMADARITAQKGYANGVSNLGADGNVPVGELSNLLSESMENQAPAWQTGYGSKGTVQVKDGSPINVPVIKGCTVNQIAPQLVDSNSDNLADGYALSGANPVSCTGGIQIFVVTTQYGGLSIFVPAGHKYLILASVKALSNSVYLQLNNGAGNILTMFHPGDNQYHFLHVMCNVISNNNGGGAITIVDRRTSGWDNISVQNFMIIDMGTASAPEYYYNYSEEDMLKLIGYGSLYLEGKQSVTNPVLTATGKNLLPNGDTMPGLHGISGSQATDQGNGFYRVPLSGNSEILQWSTVATVKEQQYTESFYFKTDSTTLSFYITFYEINNGRHNPVKAIIQSLGNGLYRAYATATVQDTVIRAIDINELAYTDGTYIDIGKSEFEMGLLTDYEPYKTTQQSISAVLRSNGSIYDEIDHVGDRYILTKRIADDGAVLSTPAVSDITDKVTGSLTAWNNGRINVSADTGVMPAVDMQYIVDAAQIGRLLTSSSGATGERPADNLYSGRQWFDTTLGKPVWYNGASGKWVDSTGSAV